MRRRSMLTTILALAGIGLTFLQMSRRNSRRSGWGMLRNRMGKLLNQMMAGPNRMMRMIRS